jgi:hypothetical protein
MNTYASWNASDLSVAGSYKLDGVRTTDYAAASASDIAADSLNLLKPTVAADVTIAAGATETLSRTIAQVSTGITIYLPEKPASITSIMSQSGTAFNPGAFADYEYNGTTGVLTFHKTVGAPANPILTITVGGGVYTLNLNIT